MTAPAPAEPIYDWSLETDHLDSLMDGDARCQVANCDGLATHALTHHRQCPFLMCAQCIPRHMKYLSEQDSLFCSTCGRRGFTVAEVAFIPV